MKYCKKCKRIYYDNKDKCECGSTSFVNEAPKNNDPVYLTTANGFELDRILSALKDEKIPYELHLEKKASSSVPVISGASNGETNILVSFSNLQKANDILIGITAKDYPGEIVDKEDEAKKDVSDYDEMPRWKRATTKVISIALFLALVTAVVFATDYVTGWIKGLF